MKLLDVVLLSFAIAVFLIGIHQSMVYGIKSSYWLFMISLSFILGLRYRLAVGKANQTVAEIKTETAHKKSNKKGKK